MHLRRILVVDDSPVFLATAISVLAPADGVQVVGTARSGVEAIEQVSALTPDLVLMDLSMPGMSGLEATRRLAEQPARPRVIIMTARDEKEYRAAALKAGADGFLSKSELDDQLVPLIATLLPEPAREAGDPGDPA